MASQRRLRQNDSLSGDKVQQLSSIGFDFTKPAEKKLTWESRYKDLVAFKDQHGHSEVPFTHALYKWMSLQRNKLKQGKLSDNQLGKIAVVEHGLIYWIQTIPHGMSLLYL